MDAEANLVVTESQDSVRSIILRELQMATSLSDEETSILTLNDVRDIKAIQKERKLRRKAKSHE